MNTYIITVLFYKKYLLSTIHFETIPLLFYMCSMTYIKSPQVWRLKTTHLFFFSTFPWVSSLDTIYLDPLLRVSQNCHQVVSWATCSSEYSNWEELFPNPLRWQQNLCSCNFRTEVSTFLLAPSSSMLPLFLSMWPSSEAIHDLCSSRPARMSLHWAKTESQRL